MASVSFLHHLQTKDDAMLHTLYGLFLALPLLGLNIVIALCINLSLYIMPKQTIGTNTKLHLKSQQQTVAWTASVVLISYLFAESWPLLLFLACALSGITIK